MSDSYKLFSVVGVSKQNDKFQVRFANSMKRAAVLKQCGNTDITLFELPEPTWKTDAVHWLLDNLGLIDNAAHEAVVNEARRLGFAM